MKIAFFTEMDFIGKVPRTHKNMRTEFAWMVALNVDHYSITSPLVEKYDLGIVIIPKNNPTFDLSHIKTKCKKIGIMQEGPHWGFQDYKLTDQVNYFNSLSESNIIFVHNNLDKTYYKGLINHPQVIVLPSLIIEEAIGKVENVERDGVIIGGNFVSWYGGFDSFIIAREITNTVVAPSMGRKQPGEEQLLTHLPYMEWKEWMHKLNEFKIGVHLMRTHAAGTFALNCAYLGIPCIGYKGLDTQEICHPSLSVDLGDLLSARKLIRKLNEDKDFYEQCSLEAKENYKNYYHEDIFNSTFKKQLEVS
jgi:hypothetical protein